MIIQKMLKRKEKTLFAGGFRPYSIGAGHVTIETGNGEYHLTLTRGEVKEFLAKMDKFKAHLEKTYNVKLEEE